MKKHFLILATLISILSCKNSPAHKNVVEGTNEEIITNTTETLGDSIKSESSTDFQPQYFKMKKLTLRIFYIL